MSAQSITRWNAIPMERSEMVESMKRSRADESDEDDDVSLVSRTPSPEPAEGMDIDKYDEYARGPAQEVVTVETKIKPSNIGFAMLARMGWQEGQPVGLSGDGRLEPVPFTVKHDQTGLGKFSQDVEMIATTVAQRRELESERWAKQSREQKETLQEDAARKAALKSSISDTLRPFYCALCDKQFKNVASFDEHTNSYAHAHKAREKDMKASMRIGAGSDDRKEKERKREERELRKLAKAQGVRMSKAPGASTSVSEPSTAPAPAEPEQSRSGWDSVGPTAAPAEASAGGWAALSSQPQTSVPPPQSSTAPSFRMGGWSSMDSDAVPAPTHTTPHAGGWSTGASAAGLTPNSRSSTGWSTLSAEIAPPAQMSLLQMVAVPSPVERVPGPEPGVASVTLTPASVPSPVHRPIRSAQEPEARHDREQKRSGWQNFRAGKTGRR